MKKVMSKVGCVALICLVIAQITVTNVKAMVIIYIALALTMVNNAYCVENKALSVFYTTCAMISAFVAGALMTKGIYLF